MKRVLCLRLPLLVACSLFLQSCGDELNLSNNVIDPAGDLTRNDYLYLRHRGDDAAMNDALAPPIPKTQAQVVPPAPPVPGNGKLVSVTVTENVPLRDVLIELARDASVNLELDPRVSGGIIFSAHNQPFDQVLKRICMLASLRATTEGAFIHIEPDDAYQQTYQLDYLSLARKSSSEMAISTNVFDSDVASAGGINGATGNVGSTSHSGADNNSTAKLSSASDADFWSEVEHSLLQILGANGHEAKGSATFSINRQSGMVNVFGNSHQQQAVDEYFRKLKRKAYSQVLIDARVIEVELDESYKSGINWRTLFGGAFNAAARFGPSAVGAPFSTATTATSGVITGDVDTHDFAAILNLMRSFGTTRVLSAPRLTVMNNQTAVLKVATNQVYFVTQAQFTTVTNANGSSVTTNPVYTSTPHTVPVGLVMTVQPSIDTDHGKVTMTLRPTISRVVGEANDPSIDLNAAIANVATPIESQIPVLAVREMDSVLQLHSGEIAVMGGLMQDSSTNNETGVPHVDTLPVVGNLTKGVDNESTTTELVILLRATITDNSPPESADNELYHRYNNDPRPWPTQQPIPGDVIDKVPDTLAPEKNDPL